jgi:predicted RNA binding protein YcfA (HicA-like mRNA interferase family)
MTRLAKLYAALLADPRGTVSFRDFERPLRAFGFEHVRTGGSHHVYANPAIPPRFPVQPSGREAKQYQVREFLGLVEAHHLDMQA